MGETQAEIYMFTFRFEGGILYVVMKGITYSSAASFTFAKSAPLVVTQSSLEDENNITGFDRETDYVWTSKARVCVIHILNLGRVYF